MIVEKIFNSGELMDSFHRYGRKDQFTYTAFHALFDILEEYSEAGDEPFILDPIAICCEFTEYTSLKEVAEAYDFDWSETQDVEDEDLSEFLIERMPDLESAIPLKYPNGEDGFLVQC